MIRLKPDERKRIIDKCYQDIFYTWTCVRGAWNRDKLLKEFEKKLRNERVRKC